MQTAKHRSATNIASPRLPIDCRDKPFTGDESLPSEGTNDVPNINLGT
jgi:predicted alpha/beta-fold hydrolase